MRLSSIVARTLLASAAATAAISVSAPPARALDPKAEIAAAEAMERKEYAPLPDSLKSTFLQVNTVFAEAAHDGTIDGPGCRRIARALDAALSEYPANMPYAPDERSFLSSRENDLLLLWEHLSERARWIQSDLPSGKFYHYGTGKTSEYRDGNAELLSVAFRDPYYDTLIPPETRVPPYSEITVLEPQEELPPKSRINYWLGLSLGLFGPYAVNRACRKFRRKNMADEVEPVASAAIGFLLYDALDPLMFPARLLVVQPMFEAFQFWYARKKTVPTAKQTAAAQKKEPPIDPWKVSMGERHE